MARVTPADLAVLIPITTIADTTVFINTASRMVDRLAASSCGSDLTEEELTDVELYLSAHFVSAADPSVAIESQKVEGSMIKASRGNVASQSGIMSTHFGQMANTLSRGCLQEVDKRKPEVFFA